MDPQYNEIIRCSPQLHSRQRSLKHYLTVNTVQCFRPSAAVILGELEVLSITTLQTHSMASNKTTATRRCQPTQQQTDNELQPRQRRLYQVMNSTALHNTVNRWLDN